MKPVVSPLAVLCLALICATILAALGKVPTATIDQLLLLVVGGALGSLAPQAATKATQDTQAAIVRAVSMAPPRDIITLSKMQTTDPPKVP
jgi:hypothetical protein